MKTTMFLLLISIFLFSLSSPVCGEEQAIHINKPLYDKMVRSGLQEHERKRYLNAKNYFKKAIIADPTSDIVWKYYDLSVVFALAEKVNNNHSLIKPGVSTISKVYAIKNVHPNSSAKNKALSENQPEVDDDGCY
ncbi:MAG: hypothetical protein GY707_15790 [Desulfobacteraceae bacterium]|nr:hypothetical protein [Desulfobacteraceae bacterium]